MENQMEQRMENEIDTLGPFKGVCRDITPITVWKREWKMTSISFWGLDSSKSGESNGERTMTAVTIMRYLAANMKFELLGSELV